MEKNYRGSSHVEISFIIHATEDPDKVLKALKNILPEEYAEDVKYEKNVLSGYHKNPIIMMKTSIKEKTRVASLLKAILGKLEADDRALLSSKFRSQIDSKGSLYLRLDKQEALLGRIKFCSGDPIRIKTKLNIVPTTLEELESISDTEK